jgi:hypothetical protein
MHKRLVVKKKTKKKKGKARATARKKQREGRREEGRREGGGVGRTKPRPMLIAAAERAVAFTTTFNSSSSMDYNNVL